MTSEQRNEAELLWRRGYSPLSIARCLTGVSYRDIEAEFDFDSQEHPAYCGHSPGFYKWLMEECPSTWRPGNPTPENAPWSRHPDHRAFY